MTDVLQEQIFVFGSNQAGRHGKGAALYAKTYYGAIYGQGHGPQGSSYAIPTKDFFLKTLPLDDIKLYVNGFLSYAFSKLGKQVFIVTRIGCGLAGYSDFQIAPMFKNRPNNVLLPDEWMRYI